MQQVKESSMLLCILRGLLWLIGGTCVIFIIFIAYIDYMPNTVTVFDHLKRFTPSLNTTNTTTELSKKAPVQKKKEERPWYLTNGTLWPSPAKIDSKTGRRDAKLWPNEDTGSDRMFNQLMFVPPNTTEPLPMKKIYFSGGMIDWEVNHLKGSHEPFVTCPVNRCRATTNPAESLDADAILFWTFFKHPGHHQPARQVWIMYRLESPINSEYLIQQDMYNWTVTYMRSSDIVHPYGRWVYYDEEQTEWPGPPRDFAAGKTGKVAWFVSNCEASNNRLEYARELAKYIQVDMYGACGAQYHCSRQNEDACFRLLETKYKFYLAFENSNCREYITEKFFVNSLKHKVIPVVMGAPQQDYELVAPKNSFIHVEDFDSPEHLAEYLHKVDQDDDLFNSYFKWRDMGELVIESYFYCRLCAMLHDDFPDKYYERIDDWWRKLGSCTMGTWRDYKSTIGGKLPKL